LFRINDGYVVMKNSDRYQSLLDVRGIALSEQFGIADIALGREDALIAVDFLKEDGVPRIKKWGQIYLLNICAY
jgi:hypothetical protein